MTRGEVSQVVRDVSNLGERQAVTETMLKTLIERTAAQDEKLDLMVKGMDELQRGQVRADHDRADLSRQLADMKPHVATVANAKTFWKVTAWIGASAGSIAAAIWAAWVWLIQYIAWK